ncbi:hypothetical protein SLS54_007654 [Diplodia seriata]
MGISALLARRSLYTGNQGPLPDNQWQLEVEHWHLASLAILQRQVVEAANGPFDQEVIPLLDRPQHDDERKVCRNQKIVNSNFSSFSVLGLTILLSVGGLINIIGYSIEWIVEAIQKRKGWNEYSRLEWTANDTLQLQRLAHEELGVGTWSATNTSYPITAKEESLAVLDISQKDHPKLLQPSKSYGEALADSDGGSSGNSGG